eukprot:735662-Prymnesium_polylepis.3
MDQHNHYDDGLYVLTYIELVSKLAPPLWKGPPYKWVAHEDDMPGMRFTSSDIDKKRMEIHDEAMLLSMLRVHWASARLLFIGHAEGPHCLLSWLPREVVRDQLVPKLLRAYHPRYEPPPPPPTGGVQMSSRGRSMAILAAS